MTPEKVERFLTAQNQSYLKALDEVKGGREVSHWMWYIFPQLKGLGRSETAQFYAINDIQEAEAYLNHPVLGANLKEISRALLEVNGKTAHEIFGSPDDLKLHSSMSLFDQVEKSDDVFKAVLEKYFNGHSDARTMDLL